LPWGSGSPFPRAGYSRLRFSHWQVKHEPAYVQGILRATAARLRDPRGEHP